MNPHHDPKSGRFSSARGGKGASLTSKATNKAGSKSVKVVNSSLAKTSSKKYGAKLTKEQRAEVKRDIRMAGPLFKPGKRTLAQETYKKLLQKEANSKS